MLVYVQEVIDYIEDNIDNPMDAKSIADHVALSVSYIKKIFKSITGLSLIDYARARKLNHCLDLVANSDQTIVDIALKNGYEYEQSFSRAFKKRFRISPKHYRQDSIAIELIPKLDLSFIVELKDAMIVRPIFKRLPSFKIAGPLHRVSVEEKFQYKPSNLANEFFSNQKKLIKKPEKANVYYGYTLPDDDHHMSTRYLTALKINADSVVPSSYHVEEVPEQEYIVFKFIGNFHASKITWEHLKSIWDYRDKYFEKTHDVKGRIYGYFEYIDGNITSDDYCELEIYVPIQK